MERHVLILAGGLGTRLRSAIGYKPKVLAPLDERTVFLDLLLENLATANVQSVTLSLGFGSSDVLRYLTARNEMGGLNVQYIIEPRPLGTGGALQHFFSETSARQVVVMNGDTWFSSFEFLEEMFLKSDEVILVGKVKDPERYGVVTVNSDGRVVGLDEKQKSPGESLISLGVYKLSAKLFSCYPGPSTEISLERFFLPRIIRTQRLVSKLYSGDFVDIGIPESYSSFCERKPWK